MKEALLLVFANKQDIAGAMKPQEVQELLKLNQLKDKIWYVVPSCATTGEGLFEGLVSTLLRWNSWAALLTLLRQGWLSNNVKTQPQRQAR